MILCFRREGSMTQSSFVEALLAPGAGRNKRLERIATLIDWTAVERLLAPLRSGEIGRKPYWALAMFKALVLQQWYGLSDPGLEEALADRLSFKRFCGFAMDEETPDHSTIWRFREAATQAGLGEALFDEIARQFEAKGLMIKTGTLIDASLTQAAVKTPPHEKGLGAASETDPDAAWTRKGGKSHFGYKGHIGVDLGSGLVRKRDFTPANVNDTVVADAIICGDEKAVYADKAYASRARRAWLRSAGVKDRIMHKSWGGGPPLTHWQKRMNALIAPLRAGVERVFGTLKRGYGLARMRYRGLSRCATAFDLMLIGYNLRRAEVLTR
jgi:IS5 family transposase